jgi:hypothetical protein
VISFDRASFLSEHDIFASERYGSTAFVTANSSQATGNMRFNNDLTLLSDIMTNQLDSDAVNKPWHPYFLDPIDKNTMLDIANSVGT